MTPSTLFAAPAESAVDRFLRYVQIATQSEEGQPRVPSTPGQWDLARMLAAELSALGAADVRVSDTCMVYATVPSNLPAGRTPPPTVGFIAHVDTSPAVSGVGVRPIVHRNYRGGDIVLPGDPTQVLTTAMNPSLLDMIGDDIITADGTTLLGSDDKAGVATIMTMVDVLMRSPEVPHGVVKVAFTADEEVGVGIDTFDVDGFGAAFAYTVDGDALGEINHETWNARAATVTFHGVSAHPGTAKGAMVNSAYALADFVLRLPADMRPETTEEREGFIHPYLGALDIERSTLHVILRDFDRQALDDKEAAIRRLAADVAGRYPGVRIEVDLRDQYPEHGRGPGRASSSRRVRHGGGAAGRADTFHASDSRGHGRRKADVSRLALSEHLHWRTQFSQPAGVQFAARPGEDHRDARASRADLRRAPVDAGVRFMRARAVAALAKRIARWSGILAAAAAVTALGPPAPTEPASAVTLTRLPPGALQPQAATDAHGVVHVVYFAGDVSHGDLFYATLNDAGALSRPIQVNHEPGDALAVGSVRGAHVAIGRGGRVHVAWTGSARARPRAGSDSAPIMYTRLDTGGTAFEPERSVTQFTVSNDGGSIAADSSGRVYVVWHGGAPGLADEADRRVWIAQSSDDGRTFARERSPEAADMGTCGCCGTAALADRQGTLYVLYRSATEVVHRDTQLLTSRDGARQFTDDQLQAWNVGACPMSTFALTDAPLGVLAAWETGGEVQWLQIDRRSRARAPIVAAPGAATNRKHPAVAQNAAGDTLLAWVEDSGWNAGGSLAWQVYDRDLRPTAAHGTRPGVPASSLVAAAVRPDGRFVILY